MVYKSTVNLSTPSIALLILQIINTSKANELDLKGKDMTGYTEWSRIIDLFCFLVPLNGDIHNYFMCAFDNMCNIIHI